MGLAIQSMIQFQILIYTTYLLSSHPGFYRWDYFKRECILISCPTILDIMSQTNTQRVYLLLFWLVKLFWTETFLLLPATVRPWGIKRKCKRRRRDLRRVVGHGLEVQNLSCLKSYHIGTPINNFQKPKFWEIFLFFFNLAWQNFFFAFPSLLRGWFWD